MQHRVVSLEFIARRGALVVRAMGKSARGTKFHIRSVTVPTKGLTKSEIASTQATAIEALLQRPDAV
jgi:hypothetical protein